VVYVALVIWFGEVRLDLAEVGEGKICGFWEELFLGAGEAPFLLTLQ
jgi:hypothetical protein